MANFQSKELFKFQVEQQARTKKNNQIKLKKPGTWLTPISSERVYEKEIKKILNKFIQITIQNIKPLLREWNRQNIILKEDISDDPIDDLENIDLLFEKEQNEIFNINIDITKSSLFAMALIASDFNKKQWNKILKKSLNVEFVLQEAWEETLLKEWVTRNVNLIKGLTNEYRKKINEAVLNAWNTGQTAESLAKELTKINKAFATGDWKRDTKGRIIRKNGVPVRKQSRANLIARDQINKLNGTHTKKRQEDAGVEWYIWDTAADERVRGRPGGVWANARPSHWAMERKICRWDDSTVYADNIEDARAGNWKSRASIGAVQFHPGQDINCRCFGSPIFNDIVEEVNQETKELEKPKPKVKPVERITKEEKESIENFTDRSYKRINKYLRIEQGQGIPEDLLFHQKRIKQDIININNYLDKTSKYKGKSYRALLLNDTNELINKRLKSKYFTNISKGDIINFKGYTSTSKYSSIFNEVDFKGKSIKMIIKGKKGVDISDLSIHKFEGEILFKNNSKFKLIKKEEIKEELFLYLEEL